MKVIKLDADFLATFVSDFLSFRTIAIQIAITKLHLERGTYLTHGFYKQTASDESST